MKRKSKLLFTLVFVATITVVFRQFLNFNNDLVWGDAPYFYNFKQLVSEPSAWVYRDDALGAVNRFVWISPIMFLYGLAGEPLGNNALLIRIFFYFPSLILAVSGAYLFSRKNGFKHKYALLSALIFILNPYYLLILDGGTVGLALAYGLFPWAVMSLRHFSVHPHKHTFLLATIINMALIVADPRIFIINIIFVFLFPTPGKKWFWLSICTFCVLLLSLYWIYPLLTMRGGFFSPAADGVKIGILYPIMLYQQHWPSNIFGQTTRPNLLFAIYPLLLVLPFVFKTQKRKEYVSWLVLFLIFSLLAKGDGDPLGSIYNYVLNHVPFAQAFRDPTKFFVPLMLTYSLLFAFVAKNIKKIYWAMFFLILINCLPIIKGESSGVLSRAATKQPIIQISQKVKEPSGRVLWFPSVHPYSINDSNTHSVSASSLAGYRPFARLNAGTYDRFNFLYNQQSAAWLGYINTKYLVFIDDPRRPVRDKKEQQHWDNLLSLVSSQDYLEETSASGQIPVYKFVQPTARINAYNKAYLIVGSDSIYNQLVDDNYQIADNLLLFSDQANLDSDFFDQIRPENLEIVFYETDLADFVFGVQARENINSGDSASVNQWAQRAPTQYLSYKYEILTKGKTFNGFDLSKEIDFSTTPNEKIVFNKKLEKNSDYKLAVRGMYDASGSATLNVTDSQGKQSNFELKPTSSLVWQDYDVFLPLGKTKIELINNQGVQVFNGISLIPRDEYDRYLSFAQQITQTHQTSYISAGEQLDKNIFNSNSISINDNSAQTFRMEFGSLKGFSWIAFTDNYHPRWQIRHDNYKFSSLPANTIGNAIYKRPEWDSVTVEFEGQRDIRWGIYFTVVSAVVIAIIYLSAKN